MVIACEKCHTRFHLEASRVPESGVRVRCSRCKHAFFVQRPDASNEETLHAAAAEAAEVAEAGAPRAPTAAADLLEGAGDEEAGDWQFNVDVPEPASESRPPSAPPARAAIEPAPPPPSVAPAPAPSLPSAPPDRAPSLPSAASDPGASPPSPSVADLFDLPRSSSLDELGDPDTWNLVPDAGGETELPALDIESRDAPTGGEDFASDALEPLDRPAPERALERAPKRRATPTGRVGARELGMGLGWSAVAAIFVLGLAGSLAGARPDLASTPAPLVLSGAAPALDGLVAEDVSVRRIENALAGPLLVASGVLVNAGGERRGVGAALAAVLLDAAGEPLGQPAPLAGLLPDHRLRLEDPEALREELAEGARRLAAQGIAPGERLGFQALFVAAPTGARALRLVPSQP